MAKKDGGFRYRWIVIPVLLLAVVGSILWIRSVRQLSLAPGPHDIYCATQDSESCYYLKSNKPVPPNPQSVTYDGAAIPTVGQLPFQCVNTFEACTYVANVGVWQVWNTDPKGITHLEATYGAPPSPPTGDT